MIDRKGIILAGGSGKRLYPLTIGMSKQLLPVYDKPMIYYSLCVLMLAGLKEILIITAPEHKKQFMHILGNGSQWGIKLSYKVQPSPDGLAQAFILAEEFLDGKKSTLILGDNIFFGHDLQKFLVNAHERQGATVFGYHVNDPERYGVVDFNSNGKVRSIIEKPENPKSNYALTGLYFVDESAPDRAKSVKASARGELEIVSLLESYLNEDKLKVQKMGQGFAWFDTGTHDSLLNAGNFVRTLTERQGLQVGSPDELAYKLGWINKEILMRTSQIYDKNEYGKYLNALIG